MMIHWRRILIFFFIVFFSQAIAQDTAYLKVHFLYGSKPLKKYRQSEQKWFGGILGGHVGIEVHDGTILSFIPVGKFHWFAKNKKKHSSYVIHSPREFYSMFGTHRDSVKKAVVYIRITQEQKHMYGSIASQYLEETPYDYAFFGMRCAAAARDILSKMNVLPKQSIRKTCRKTFYPRKLRNELFRMAEANEWEIRKSVGSSRRLWDKR